MASFGCLMSRDLCSQVMSFRLFKHRLRQKQAQIDVISKPRLTIVSQKAEQEKNPRAYKMYLPFPL